MKFFFVATAVVLRTFFGWVLCCCCNEPKASIAFAANDDVMHHMCSTSAKKWRTWLFGPTQMRIMVMMAKNKPHDVISTLFYFSLCGF